MKNYPFSFRYYLFRPWRFIEATLKNIKYAGQRVFRGWSDRDAWDTGTSIVENIIEMLEYPRLGCSRPLTPGLRLQTPLSPDSWHGSHLLGKEISEKRLSPS